MSKINTLPTDIEITGLERLTGSDVDGVSSSFVIASLGDYFRGDTFFGGETGRLILTDANNRGLPSPARATYVSEVITPPTTNPSTSNSAYISSSTEITVGTDISTAFFASDAVNTESRFVINNEDGTTTITGMIASIDGNVITVATPFTSAQEDAFGSDSLIPRFEVIESTRVVFDGDVEILGSLFGVNVAGGTSVIFQDDDSSGTSRSLRSISFNTSNTEITFADAGGNSRVFSPSVLTATEIATLYEGLSDRNQFTNALLQKLNNLPNDATNHEVVANPGGTGNDNLSSIGINGTNYNIVAGDGTTSTVTVVSPVLGIDDTEDPIDDEFTRVINLPSYPDFSLTALTADDLDDNQNLSVATSITDNDGNGRITLTTSTALTAEFTSRIFVTATYERTGSAPISVTDEFDATGFLPWFTTSVATAPTVALSNTSNTSIAHRVNPNDPDNNWFIGEFTPTNGYVVVNAPSSIDFANLRLSIGHIAFFTAVELTGAASPGYTSWCIGDGDDFTEHVAITVGNLPANTGNGVPGERGPRGLQGRAGMDGGIGSNGTDGNRILTGTIDPTSLIGNEGDLYLNTSTSSLFGPRTATVWPSTSLSLIGEKGDQGDTGEGISTIIRTATNGLVDTYTVTFTDSATTTFNITNGSRGPQGDQGDKGDKGDQGDRGEPGTILNQTNIEGAITNNSEFLNDIGANRQIAISGTDFNTLNNPNEINISGSSVSLSPDGGGGVEIAINHIPISDASGSTVVDTNTFVNLDEIRFANSTLALDGTDISTRRLIVTPTSTGGTTPPTAVFNGRITSTVANSVSLAIGNSQTWPLSISHNTGFTYAITGVQVPTNWTSSNQTGTGVNITSPATSVSEEEISGTIRLAGTYTETSTSNVGSFELSITLRSFIPWYAATTDTATVPTTLSGYTSQGSFDSPEQYVVAAVTDDYAQIAIPTHFGTSFRFTSGGFTSAPDSTDTTTLSGYTVFTFGPITSSVPTPITITR